MDYFWLHVIFIAQFFTLRFSKSYGELIMLRYPSNNTNEYSYECITANDGSALVWNIEPGGAVSEYEPDSTRNICVGVVFGSLKNCISEENVIGKFEEVLSIDYPMDPVFDYRWEGFEEANSSFTLNVGNATTVVFSARTCETLNVRLTENNSTSLISSVTLPTSEQCDNRKNNSNAGPVLKSSDNPMKWHTYIMKWNERYKLDLFQNGTTKNYSYDLPESSSKITKMHFDIPDSTRLRVHWYRYFLTNKTGSELRLTNLPQPIKLQFCVHLVISLCEECQFEVRIDDGTGNRLNKTFSRRGSTNTGLPFWQIETLNVTVKTNTTRSPTVILFIRTAKKGDITDGRWALGGIPYCESQNTISAQDDSRYTNLIVKKINDQKLPKVFCEKLFYTENSVVNSEATFTNAISRMSRPISKSYCNSAPDRCKGLIICNLFNCNCAPGYNGFDCDQECPKGNYGYGCQDTCHHCFSKSCDNIMGKCNSKCTGNRVFPYCKKSLQIPMVEHFCDTSATLRWDSFLDEEERQNFNIELNNGVGDCRSVPVGSEKRKRVAGLVPCSTYEVRFVIGTPKHGITRSDKQNFTTRWNPPTNLTVTREKLGCIKLNWLHNSSNTKQPVFKVSYRQLTTSLKTARTLLPSSRQHKDNRTTPKYAVDLCLLTASKYIFTVTAADDKLRCGNASAQMTYYIPPRPSFGGAELQVSRNDFDSIELVIPPVMNDTTQSKISLDVIAKPNCSISNIRSYDSERVWKSANRTGTEPISVTMLGNGSINLIMKRDTELCQLLPYESHDVKVTVSDGHSRQSLSGRIESLESYLNLTIGMGVTFVICATFVVYFGYKFVHSRVGLHHSNEKMQTTTIPYESLHSQSAREEKLKNFEKGFRKSVENGVMLQQFRELPRGLVRPCKIGILPKNRSKNRYGNFIAYDDTRVILGGGCSSDDYINANYIDGYCKEKAYIATQAPIPETVDDFWRMIWQEEVTIICMLVDVHDGDKKICEQYWPKNVKARKDYGEYAVCNMEERVHANFIHRSLLMVTCYDEKSRMIEHLQYTEWSDEEVPTSSHSVVEYLNELRSIHTRGGPVVVHCSSGAGRTGTIILCDISTRRIADKGTVDIFAEARKMFEARANMLSNFKQFVLTHVVAVEYLLPPPTKITCGEIMREKIEQFKTELPMLMSRLEGCSWMDKSMYCLDPVKPPAYENISKNRFRKLTPVSSRLVILQRYPTHDIHSDYISAVSVDGVYGKRYITSQLPLPSTLTDFWRLIIEKNVRVIVILQRPDPENNDSCCDVVPRGTLIPVPNVNVKTESSSNANKFFTMDTLSLTNTSTVPASKRKIVALTCENWSLDEDARPPEPEALVNLWIAVKRTWRCGPILVLCYDGVKGCGLYVTMSYMLDRMSSERECDVISATRAVQRSRQEFMTEQWQFEYLYDAAVQHAEAFKTYANVS